MLKFTQIYFCRDSLTIKILLRIAQDINHNKDATLLYLTKCARLAAASSSITWHSSSQHLLRLGCPLPGYQNLLLPKQSKPSPAVLRFSRSHV